MEENRAVSIGLTEIVGPSVNVGVEMHQSERSTVPFGGSTQQRKCHSVIAAERDKVTNGRCLFLYERQASLNVAERDTEVADVGH